MIGDRPTGTPDEYSPRGRMGIIIAIVLSALCTAAFNHQRPVRRRARMQRRADILEARMNGLRATLDEPPEQAHRSLLAVNQHKAYGWELQSQRTQYREYAKELAELQWLIDHMPVARALTKRKGSARASLAPAQSSHRSSQWAPSDD